MRYFWIMAGILALCCGVIGIFLPLWPTVPFLLLSAFCFARGSARLHNWLVTHPKLGRPINDWAERGAIGEKSKLYASISLLATLGISLILGLSAALLALQSVVLAAVALFIWSRPSA